MIWGIRETFVSVIAISAPAIKPLFNKSRWIGSSADTGASSSGFQRIVRRPSILEINTTNHPKYGKEHDIETGDSSYRKGSVTPLSDMELKDISISRHGSQESIIEHHQFKSLPLEINVTTVYALVVDEGNDVPVSPDTTMDMDVAKSHPGTPVAIGGSLDCNSYRASTPVSPTTREDHWRPRGENITEISVGERAGGSASKASRMLGLGSDD